MGVSNEDAQVTFPAAAVVLASALGVATLAADPATLPRPLQIAQVTVREQIIIRTMRVRPNPAPKSTPVDWKEVRKIRCVQATAISGAAQLGQRSVDLVLRNGNRVRAQLSSSCPALDYYYGFYITPSKDGMICADRDFIRSRVGGHCEIDAFRSLQGVAQR